MSTKLVNVKKKADPIAKSGTVIEDVRIGRKLRIKAILNDQESVALHVYRCDGINHKPVTEVWIGNFARFAVTENTIKEACSIQFFVNKFFYAISNNLLSNDEVLRYKDGKFSIHTI